jgi:hypothetical protein
MAVSFACEDGLKLNLFERQVSQEYKERLVLLEIVVKSVLK